MITDRVETVVVGGGQAGLSVSRELTAADVTHVVLERGRIGQTWRGRWDGFCLVTPNWSVQLPGHSYDGDDPDGFMPRDEIVRYLERYASAVDAPVREGIDVMSIGPRPGGGFDLDTRTAPWWRGRSCSAPAPTNDPTVPPVRRRSRGSAPDRRRGLPQPESA